MRSITMMAAVATAVLAFGATTACTKKDDAGTATTTATTASATPASPCGSDWADPKKEFCLKLPEGFEAKADPDPGELYVEIMKFDGSMAHFTVSVGFSSSNFKSYDEAVGANEKWLAESKSIKMDSSGKTAAGGKWWLYTNSGTDVVESSTKSNGDKVINCTSNDKIPAVVDACKSIRAYPK